jgi:flagellar biosynthesis GTPase FlhF
MLFGGGEISRSSSNSSSLSMKRCVAENDCVSGRKLHKHNSRIDRFRERERERERELLLAILISPRRTVFSNSFFGLVTEGNLHHNSSNKVKIKKEKNYQRPSHVNVTSTNKPNKKKHTTNERRRKQEKKKTKKKKKEEEDEEEEEEREQKKPSLSAQQQGHEIAHRSPSPSPSPLISALVPFFFFFFFFLRGRVWELLASLHAPQPLLL